jgi:phosphatidylglycerophosphate synthase|tara:strand:- start:1163 stop:1882 length:720 start_codon:yes stop_codon:yes gene_type:complete
LAATIASLINLFHADVRSDMLHSNDPMCQWVDYLLADANSKGPGGLLVMSWFSWANLLSISRLGAAIPCAYAVIEGVWVIAAVLFIYAVLSDFIDGYVARNLGEVSALGGLLDHTSDACFVTLTLAAFAYLGLVPAPLPLLIAAAFLQYVLDSRALVGSTLRASVLGRGNGICYFILAGLAILAQLTQIPWPSWWLMVLGWLLVATTVTSMLDRAWALLNSRQRNGLDSTTENTESTEG